MKQPFRSIILLFAATLFLPTALGLCFRRGSGSVPHSSEPLSFTDSTFVVSCLDTQKNELIAMSLEEYLVGVLAAEMPAAYEPEALKAQAVASRSYILSKASAENSDHPKALVCTDSTHCEGWLSEEAAKSRWKPHQQKAYWEKLKKAVKDTSGEYMTYQDQAVEAFFFASGGNRTENSEDVWGGERPYLRSVENIFDTEAVSSTHAVTFSDFAKKLQPHFQTTLPTNQPPSLSVPERTTGGSVKEIRIYEKPFSGREIRSIFGLKSANFTITTTDTQVIFQVVGSGHGVGMSQTGANSMAKSGKKYTEILSHYYTNIQIAKL